MVSKPETGALAIVSALHVIRPQSAASAKGFSNFPEADLN